MTMMVDTIAPSSPIDVLHRRALASTRSFVSGIAAEQWSDPTPCDGWDVRALVNHIVAGNLWAAELASGHSIDEVGGRLDGDVLGDAPLQAYDRSAEMAAAAFEATGALEAPYAVSYGPVPGSVYAGHRFIDVLIHGWDIAVATGQPSALDPQLVEACRQVIAPQLQVLQASGMFGSPAAGGADSDPQAQLLRSLGRHVDDLPPGRHIAAGEST
jgi:uncharacterized protein (TIGR03086 family)